jgi:hypothetical protein
LRRTEVLELFAESLPKEYRVKRNAWIIRTFVTREKDPRAGKGGKKDRIDSRRIDVNKEKGGISVRNTTQV